MNLHKNMSNTFPFSAIGGQDEMKLAIHIHRGKWHDVGRMEDYIALTERGEEII